MDTKYWSVGHKFTLKGPTGEELVKAKQKFTWNPKTWFLPIYKVAYLDEGKWKSAVIRQKKFWDFKAYKTLTLEAEGEKFGSTGKFFTWKFELKSKKDGAVQPLPRLTWPARTCLSLKSQICQLMSVTWMKAIRVWPLLPLC